LLNEKAIGPTKIFPPFLKIGIGEKFTIKEMYEKIV
jgi:hypothetical protein